MKNKKFLPKNKKALSTIVATAIVILISLIAISILWVTINNVNKGLLMSPEISCLDIKTKEPIKIKSTCFNQETNEVEITLSRNLQDIKINKIEFFIEEETQTSEWCCGGIDCPYCEIQKQAETKTYYFNADENAKKSILKINECFIETKDVEVC